MTEPDPDVPGDGTWLGEPGLGGWYTTAETQALAEVAAAMPTWRHTYTREYQHAFEAAFAAHVGVAHAISVTSGGVALDLAMTALDATDGDEVISCAINFSGTHLAVLGRRLRLVLAEPDPDTLNLDPNEVGRRMTRRTVAIVVTHMNGLPADVGAIAAAATARAEELGIATPRIIVDAARACGAASPVGTVGAEAPAWVTMFSFHRKKLMTTLGEGGMLTTNDDHTAARLRRLRSFGHGQQWGSNYRMTEYAAAVGSVQLRRLEDMLAPRLRLARSRTALLVDTPGLTVPAEPAGYRHVYYLYTVLLDRGWPAGTRDRLRAMLDTAGIGTVVANPPTYTANTLIADAVADQQPLRRAEDVAHRLLCPALHPLMSDADNTRVAETLSTAVDQLARP